MVLKNSIIIAFFCNSFIFDIWLDGGGGEGGTGVYSYRWQVQKPGMVFTNSTDCQTSSPLTCIVNTNFSTEKGLYGYRLAIKDMAGPDNEILYTQTLNIDVISAPIATLRFKIINSQNIATNYHFQQMILFNTSNYKTHESNNLGNMRFYQGNTELYSRCESGCTNTSPSAIFWIKLSDGISANGNITITMKFLPTNENYDSNFAGEAPQLSSNYGQYDNGGQIFNYYWNFNGSSMPPTWQIGDPENTSVIINNGITIFSHGTCSGRGALCLYIPTAQKFNSRVAVDFLVPVLYDVYAGGFIVPNSFSAPMLTGAYVREACGYLTPEMTDNSIPLCQSYGVLTNRVPPFSAITSIETLSNTSAIGLYNYSTTGTDQPMTDITIPYPLPIAVGGGNGNENAYKVQWIRIRVLPPNGIMPTAMIV